MGRVRFTPRGSGLGPRSGCRAALPQGPSAVGVCMPVAAGVGARGQCSRPGSSRGLGLFFGGSTEGPAPTAHHEGSAGVASPWSRFLGASAPAGREQWPPGWVWPVETDTHTLRLEAKVRAGCPSALEGRAGRGVPNACPGSSPALCGSAHRLAPGPPTDGRAPCGHPRWRPAWVFRHQPRVHMSPFPGGAALGCPAGAPGRRWWTCSPSGSARVPTPGCRTDPGSACSLTPPLPRPALSCTTSELSICCPVLWVGVQGRGARLKCHHSP